MLTRPTLVSQNSMHESFFDQPIRNSPYEYPTSHWELDADGQPTGKIIERQLQLMPF